MKKMSLCIFIGVAMGCWALLSVVSGERFRQQQEIDAAKKAREKALAEAESPPA